MRSRAAAPRCQIPRSRLSGLAGNARRGPSVDRPQCKRRQLQLVQIPVLRTAAPEQHRTACGTHAAAESPPTARLRRFGGQSKGSVRGQALPMKGERMRGARGVDEGDPTLRTAQLPQCRQDQSHFPNAHLHRNELGEGAHGPAAAGQQGIETGRPTCPPITLSRPP